MSLNVFYFLHVDNKFVKLTDLDEVFCKFFQKEVSSENYLIPEGNTVCWVDMLTGILLELPSCIKSKNMDFEEIMDAVYHYNSLYRIGDVNSYVRCFYYAHILRIKINAHYADISIFDDETRKHYRGLYDKNEWFSKEELEEYVSSIWDESILEKPLMNIVNDMYIRRKNGMMEIKDDNLEHEW